MNRLLIDGLEAERLILQEKVDGEKTQGERNELGQFATPPVLSLEIMKAVKTLWPSSRGPIHFCDPAFGTGSFYAALRRVFSAAQVASCTGVELDKRFADCAKKLWQDSGLLVVQDDFIRVISSGAVQPPNLLVTNPPYVRHHHMSTERKEALKAKVADATGYNLSMLAGFYVYYLMLATEWMQDGGMGVWLIPSEFMDVNYGSVLRDYLCERVTLTRAHRFDAGDVQFGDALVSSVILFFDKTKPAPGHKVSFTYAGPLTKPLRTEKVPLETLRASYKWTAFPHDEKTAFVRKPGAPGLLVGDLFRIRRGIATGANNVFILPKVEAERLGLPERFIKPILPAPRNLRETVIESTPDGYPDLPEQLAVIDCNLPEKDLAAECPALWEYLKPFKEAGITDGYILSHRAPWFSQEQRPPCQFLCTYMGRSGENKTAFRFIWNKSKATATNVYLMLYPKPPLAGLLSDPKIQAQTFELLQGISPESLHGEGRVYGGGLRKIEPRELEKVDASGFLKLLPKTEKQSGLWGA